MESVLLSKKEFKYIMEVLPKVSKKHYDELKCVYFNGDDVVALDGYRMSIRKLSKSLRGSYLVYGEGLKKVIKAIKREVEYVELVFGDKSLVVTLYDKNMMVMYTYELGYNFAKYIDYKSFMCSKFNGYVITDSRLLCNVVKKLNGIVALEVIKGSLMGLYSVQSTEDGRHCSLIYADSVLMNKKFGDDILIGFNTKFLAQALVDFKDKVMIRYVNNVNGVVITDEGETRYEFVLPVRMTGVRKLVDRKSK